MRVTCYMKYGWSVCCGVFEQTRAVVPQCTVLQCRQICCLADSATQDRDDAMFAYSRRPFARRLSALPRYILVTLLHQWEQVFLALVAVCVPLLGHLQQAGMI